MHDITKQTYGAQITEYIKKRIASGKYAPGDKINEVAIADRLKVSRAPVREALQHLAENGFLVSVPQKGKFIAQLTAKEIEDSYFTGGVLEGAAASSSISLFTDADFMAMENLVESMKTLGTDPDSRERMAQLDDAFHDCMFSRSDNALLRLLSRRSCQVLSKFILYSHWRNAFTPQEIYERHKDLLQAVKSRDPIRIENAIRAHYQEAGARMARHGAP